MRSLIREKTNLYKILPTLSFVLIIRHYHSGQLPFIRLPQSGTIFFCRVGTICNDLSRIADHNTVARHIKIDVCIRRDQNIVANGYFPHHHGVGPDPDAVADCRRAFAASSILTPDGNTRCNVAVIPDFRSRIDNDRSVMPYKEPGAYFRFCGNMKRIFFIQHFQPPSVKQIQQFIVLCVIICFTIRYNAFETVIEEFPYKVYPPLHHNSDKNRRRSVVSVPYSFPFHSPICPLMSASTISSPDLSFNSAMDASDRPLFTAQFMSQVEHLSNSSLVTLPSR